MREFEYEERGAAGHPPALLAADGFIGRTGGGLAPVLANQGRCTRPGQK